MDDTNDEGSDLTGLDLFNDPDGFYAAEKSATSTKYITKNGRQLSLRLVGHNPLWGHLLWNAGQVIARYIEDNAIPLVQHKTVLELGAGAGLPSLICALYGAKRVVVTDYPDHDLISNLQYNIEHSINRPESDNVTALGYLWGNDVTTLKTQLDTSSDGFDLLILADILFNHSEHDKLVSTILQTLKKSSTSQALVFFTPYRPWLISRDLAFFENARANGLVVEKLFEHVLDKVMFPEDPGDELLRRTVFAYEVKWPA